MATHTSPDFTTKIAQAIEAGVRELAEKEYQKVRSEMLERMDAAKDEALAAITLRLMKHLVITDIGDRLTIELKTEDFKKVL